MKGFKAIAMLALMLCLSAVAVSGVAYGQTFMVDQTGSMAYPYGLDCKQNSLDDAQVTIPTHAVDTASGQSIIYNNGMPTTVISGDGTQKAYSASMWDFLAGYETSSYGVGISSNPDVPIGGTWVQVTESGTLGTQEPNLNLS